MRAVGAAVLSALIPGAGQLYARRPWRALAFFLPLVALGVAAFMFIDRGTLGMADLLVRPSFLTSLLVVDVLVLIWRVTAVVDAFLISSKSGERGWIAVPLSLLLLIVAAPHAIAWDYGTRSISALNATFVAAPSGSTISLQSTPPLDPLKTIHAPQLPTTQRFVLRESPRPAAFTVGLGDPLAIEAWVDIVNINTKPAPYAPPANPLDTNRLTILLVGADEGPGRDGLRTDSMNVATIDLDTGEAALFGLPRNLKLMPLPQRFEESFIELEEQVIEKDLTDEDGDGFPDHWVDED